jgi:hypothetical protein
MGYTILGRTGEPRPEQGQYRILGRTKSPEEETEEAIKTLDSLPHPEGFLHKLPRNLAIGLLKLGHTFLNYPHDIIKGAEDAGSYLGKKVGGLLPHDEFLNHPRINVKEPFRLSSILPHQEEQDFAGMLGQKGEGTLMDKLLQGAVEYSPDIVSIGGLVRHGLNALPITKVGASKRLSRAEKAMEGLGAPKTPINFLDVELAKQKKFIPDTKEYNEVLSKAMGGDYKSAFAFQSDVGKAQRNLAKGSALDRVLAEEAKSIKQRAIDAMENKLRMHGYADVADDLIGGLGDYRQYIKFRDKVKPIMKTIGIPASVLGVLGLGYSKGKQMLKQL